MGETCTVTQSGTTLAKYCENGCCSNECCDDTSADNKAVAIAMAVILGLLLLAALIVLIVYCWLKRKKRDNRTDPGHKDTQQTEMQDRRNKHKNIPNGTVFGYTNPLMKTNRLVQTGDPNPDSRDYILWGRARRWSSSPNTKTTPARRTWNQSVRPADGFSQTDHYDATGYSQILTHRSNSPVMSSSTLLAPYYSEVTELQDKGIQTPVLRWNHSDSNKAIREKNKMFMATWTPTAPWRPSNQLKSLEKNKAGSLKATSNGAPKEVEPFYPVHRHPPESSDRSDHSESLNRSRSIDFDIKS